jgi:hypothetical protein
MTEYLLVQLPSGRLALQRGTTLYILDWSETVISLSERFGLRLQLY